MSHVSEWGRRRTLRGTLRLDAMWNVHVDMEVGKAWGMMDCLFKSVGVSKMTDTSLISELGPPSSSFPSHMPTL